MNPRNLRLMSSPEDADTHRHRGLGTARSRVPGALTQVPGPRSQRVVAEDAWAPTWEPPGAGEGQGGPGTLATDVFQQN